MSSKNVGGLATYFSGIFKIRVKVLRQNPSINQWAKNSMIVLLVFNDRFISMTFKPPDPNPEGTYIMDPDLSLTGALIVSLPI